MIEFLNHAGFTMRGPFALLAALAFASPAPALSIRPPQAWLQASPDGQFVYVSPNAGWSSSNLPNDPDIAAIRERCKTAGLYRRGEWDAPVWELDLGSTGHDDFWLSNDGVHAVYRSRISPLYIGWFGPDVGEREKARRVLEIEAFVLYANGRVVRRVSAGETVRDPFAVLGKGDWLETAEFGPDGRFYVTAKDGNCTAFDPSTGERVEGEGHPGVPYTLRERMQSIGRAVDDLEPNCGWGNLGLAAATGALLGCGAVLLGRRDQRHRSTVSTAPEVNR